jgi:hypothetical protein
MRSSRVGERFHLDVDGTAIAGRYIEVDRSLAPRQNFESTDVVKAVGMPWRRFGYRIKGPPFALLSAPSKSTVMSVTPEPR